VNRRCDNGKERQRFELVVRAEEGERELQSEEGRCGVLRGCSSPFIWAGGAPGWRQRAVNGVNAIDGGARRRGIINEGFKAGESKFLTSVGAK
jgi:hypothetical protein